VTNALAAVLFVGYSLSLLFYLMHFDMQKEGLMVWAKRVLSVALALHLAFLGALFFKHGGGNLQHLSVYLVSFFIILASSFMEWRYKAPYLMLFSLPIALIFSLVAFLGSQPPADRLAVFQSRWLWLHVGLILVGFAGLLIAVSSALMYLLQSYQIKSKHLGKVFLKLPSLDTLDRVHFRSLSAGIILFSLGILFGISWARDLKEPGGVLRDPKVILSFVTCILYWLVLGFRLSALRRGQKIAFGTLLVFLLLWVTFLSTHQAPTLAGA